MLVYPLRIKILKLEYVPPFESEFEFEISKSSTSKELRFNNSLLPLTFLRGLLAQRYGFPPHKVRLWFENKVKMFRLLKPEELMEDLFTAKGCFTLLHGYLLYQVE